MKSTSVVVGLLVGCIIAACTNYFDNTGINAVSLFHQLLGLLNSGGYFLVGCIQTGEGTDLASINRHPPSPSFGCRHSNSQYMDL